MNRRNGKLSGSWINWYSNGNKNEEGIYKDGKKKEVFGMAGLEMVKRNIAVNI